jgi:hypothetical protein
VLLWLLSMEMEKDKEMMKVDGIQKEEKTRQ